MVVASSSWRLHHSIAEIGELRGPRGFRGEIIGATPALHHTPDGVKPVRGDEIHTWIAANDGVEAFVILDDVADMAHLGDALVQTDATDGLTAREAERAIAVLVGTV